MIPVWEVDANGDIMEHYLWTQEEIDSARAEGRHIVDFPWGNSNLYKPKFDLINNFWYEGMTEDEIVETLKPNKLKELNEACNQAILGRFSAQVNGKTYWFSHDYEAQSNFEMADKNLNNGRISSVTWTCYDAPVDGNVYRITMDKTSFEPVYIAHAQAILGNVSKFRDILMPRVEAANTLKGLEEITWDG
jgi:hypothetical protein